MNKVHPIFEQILEGVKTIGLGPHVSRPVEDVKLWNELGNSCRATLYHIAENHWELYLQDFNGSVPVRYNGPLNIVRNVMELWIASQKEKGFVHPIPEDPSHAWKA